MSSSTMPVAPHPLWWLAGLLISTLLSVAWFRWHEASTVSASSPSRPPEIVQRSLLFRDEPDGSISVTDAHTQKPVAQFHGEQGFVRGTLRALSRERRRQGLDNAHPFTLSLGADRRIILRDPSTGEHIDLASFGTSNREVFSSLLLDPSHEAFKPSAGAHP